VVLTKVTELIVFHHYNLALLGHRAIRLQH